MLSIRKEKILYYSQNSLNTFKNCPRKFQLKYRENILWKNDELGYEDYYDNIEIGLDFHLICERYFSGIPVGELSGELSLWYEKLKLSMPISKDNIHLTEYEMKMKKNNIALQAKFDLIIIKPNGEIEAWDFKTENRKLKLKELRERIQTMVYMYVLGEVGEEILGVKISKEKIKMNFWQPQFSEEVMTIDYDIDMHMINEEKLKKLISSLENYDFNKEFIMNDHVKHCPYCEFKNLCDF